MQPIHDGIGKRFGAKRSAQIARALTILKCLVVRALNALPGVVATRILARFRQMIQHHDGRHHQGKWIGNALASNIGRGTVDRLEDGGVIAMTPDGPRGPRMRAKRGPVQLAKLAGSPLMAIAWSTSNCIVFHKSWDHFILPLPFGHGALIWGDPIAPPPMDASDAEIEAVRLKLENEMNRIAARIRCTVQVCTVVCGHVASRRCQMVCGAPRGAVCPDGGERPSSLGRRSGRVKLAAASATGRWLGVGAAATKLGRPGTAGRVGPGERDGKVYARNRC